MCFETLKRHLREDTFLDAEPLSIVNNPADDCWYCDFCDSTDKENLYLIYIKTDDRFGSILAGVLCNECICKNYPYIRRKCLDETEPKCGEEGECAPDGPMWRDRNGRE